ncbi:RNA polymerase sigma factor [Metapseudomonas resinovorans]|uniref:sigma-70 family RNA polymerase sigma factor n=1 Tax=Metapseudomonas resinovorans TaxID=53412 RepID=UPI0009841170|nr:sigma-70 family RNA polymerase sigma factor [Pseudomonas resinovorans]GLZ87605.1 RNA polymerase sigma factor [Pseudomonas resinovorans]
MRKREHGFFEHYEELIGTWTRRLRSRHRAEDFAHDAFVRVLEADQGNVQQPRAYLHQTTRNIAVDHFRREERRALLEMDIAGSGDESKDDPESFMHAVQLADSIEKALAELPVNCRQVFVWQKLEGLSQAEIAERLGLSKNMVERYMIRTIRHLRERLDLSAT